MRHRRSRRHRRPRHCRSARARALAWRMPPSGLCCALWESGPFAGMTFREIERDEGTDTLSRLYQECQASAAEPGSPEHVFIEVFDVLAGVTVDIATSCRYRARPDQPHRVRQPAVGACAGMTGGAASELAIQLREAGYVHVVSRGVRWSMATNGQTIESGIATDWNWIGPPRCH